MNKTEKLNMDNKLDEMIYIIYLSYTGEGEHLKISNLYQCKMWPWFKCFIITARNKNDERPSHVS